MTGESVTHNGPDATRLRAIQLAGAADWPKRCAPYAAAVEGALRHEGGSRHDEGSRQLADGKLFEHLSIDSDVEALLTPAADERIVALADVARDVPAPPAPTLLAHDVVTVASRASQLTELGDHDLALVLSEQVACRFAARDGGLDPVAHCSYPADAFAQPRRWSLVRTTTAELQVVADDGIRAFATGELVLATTTPTAQASDVAGSLFVWPRDATRTSVLRRAPTGATTILPLPHKLDGSATVVRDQLLWTEHGRVVGVDLSGPKVGPIYVVAKAAHLPEPVTCATTEIAAALVVSGDDTYRVAVLANGAWQLSATGPRYDLHCSGATVTGLTAEARSSGLEIARLDCTAAGCTPSTARIGHIAGPFAVAPIGSATIVVWVDDLVRGISGPLSGLATAKPFAIYDGSRFEQLSRRQTSATELIQGVDVVGRGASAIVVLHGDGVRLVHVRDGKPERVDVVFD
ncbi:MAG: hypothetical protein ABI591_23940 [Kofleriaceae bacterium]